MKQRRLQLIQKKNGKSKFPEAVVVVPGVAGGVVGE